MQAAHSLALQWVNMVDIVSDASLFLEATALGVDRLDLGFLLVSQPGWRGLQLLCVTLGRVVVQQGCVSLAVDLALCSGALLVMSSA